MAFIAGVDPALAMGRKGDTRLGFGCLARTAIEPNGLQSVFKPRT